MNAYVAFKVSTRVCRKANYPPYIVSLFLYMALKSVNILPAVVHFLFLKSCVPVCALRAPWPCSGAKPSL